MKIGILTHPQGSNYGGLLQCYALFTYLKKIGNEPIVIQRTYNKSFFIWEWIRSLLILLHFPRYYHPNTVDRNVNIRPFIENYLVRTAPIDSQYQMKSVCKKYNLDVVIVGSDQVWRKSFAMKFGYNYFLDFVPDNVTRVSYAASFGLSEWLYSTSQTKAIKKLLSRFSGISVREEDGVSLLKQNLGIDSIQLLDPTLLLTAEDYEIITNRKLEKEKYVFVYWLGDKSLIAEDIKKFRSQGYKVIELNLRDDQEQISVEDWLSYIKYADFVITDSFHGSVFSILFERQFTVFANASGGNGRISSLCSMLGIEPEGYKDYSNMNIKLNNLRVKSIEYLVDMTKYKSFKQKE